MNKRLLKVIAVVLAVLTIGGSFSIALVAFAEPASEQEIVSTPSGEEASLPAGQLPEYNAPAPQSSDSQESTPEETPKEVHGGLLVATLPSITDDIGNITVTLTNKEDAKKKYVVVMKYVNTFDGYRGTSSEPIAKGVYDIAVNYKDKDIKFEVNEKEFDSQKSDSLAFTLKSYKDKNSGLGGILRNSFFTITLIAVTLIGFAIYKKKTSVEEQEGAR